MKTILFTPDRRRLRTERRRAATTALVAPVVPLAFLVDAFDIFRPVFGSVSDFQGALAFAGGVAVGGSIVLAAMSSRRFMQYGGTRLKGILLAVLAPAVAAGALAAGRFPWP